MRLATIVGSLAAGMLLVLLSGCAALPERLTADPAAAATAAWRAAYDSRDPARITALYDADAVLWGTTAKAIAATPAGIADYFKDAATRPTARVEIGEQHTRRYGDVAVNSGVYTFSETRDGRPFARAARFTFVFRHHDGRWFIVAHHSSLLP